MDPWLDCPTSFFDALTPEYVKNYLQLHNMSEQRLSDFVRLIKDNHSNEISQLIEASDTVNIQQNMAFVNDVHSQYDRINQLTSEVSLLKSVLEKEACEPKPDYHSIKREIADLACQVANTRNRLYGELQGLCGQLQEAELVLTKRLRTWRQETAEQLSMVRDDVRGNVYQIKRTATRLKDEISRGRDAAVQLVDDGLCIYKRLSALLQKRDIQDKFNRLTGIKQDFIQFGSLQAKCFDTVVYLVGRLVCAAQCHDSARVHASMLDYIKKQQHQIEQLKASSQTMFQSSMLVSSTGVRALSEINPGQIDTSVYKIERQIGNAVRRMSGAMSRVEGRVKDIKQQYLVYIRKSLAVFIEGQRCMLNDSIGQMHSKLVVTSDRITLLEQRFSNFQSDRYFVKNILHNYRQNQKLRVLLKKELLNTNMFTPIQLKIEALLDMVNRINNHVRMKQLSRLRVMSQRYIQVGSLCTEFMEGWCRQQQKYLDKLGQIKHRVTNVEVRLLQAQRCVSNRMEVINMYESQLVNFESDASTIRQQRAQIDDIVHQMRQVMEDGCRKLERSIASVRIQRISACNSILQEINDAFESQRDQIHELQAESLKNSGNVTKPQENPDIVQYEQENSTAAAQRDRQPSEGSVSPPNDVDGGTVEKPAMEQKMCSQTQFIEDNQELVISKHLMTPQQLLEHRITVLKAVVRHNLVSKALIKDMDWIFRAVGQLFQGRHVRNIAGKFGLPLENNTAAYQRALRIYLIREWDADVERFLLGLVGEVVAKRNLHKLLAGCSRQDNRELSAKLFVTDVPSLYGLDVVVPVLQFILNLYGYQPSGEPANPGKILVQDSMQSTLTPVLQPAMQISK